MSLRLSGPAPRTNALLCLSNTPKVNGQRPASLPHQKNCRPLSVRFPDCLYYYSPPERESSTKDVETQTDRGKLTQTYELASDGRQMYVSTRMEGGRLSQPIS